MALVRIKRQLTEEPAEALLIACKRIRTDDSGAEVVTSEDLSSIFTFAGTFDSKDKLESPQIALAVKETHHKNPKRRVVDILDRKRKESETAKKKSRLKVVNSFRAQLACEEIDFDPENKLSNFDLCVYDVEDEEEKNDLKNASFLKECPQSAISCNGIELIREDTSSKLHSYVYDLYYTSEFNEGGVVLENTFNIERYFDPAANDYRDDSSDHLPSDDEDSNDENYYKNDYPDEDSDFENTGCWDDYKDGDICELLASTHLDKDESSEDDECSYSGPEPDKSDILYHGEYYARFKAKALNDKSDADLDE